MTIGLTRDHDQSYAHFMRANLFDHVNIGQANCNFPDGTNHAKLTDSTIGATTSVSSGSVKVLLPALIPWASAPSFSCILADEEALELVRDLL